MDLSFLHQGLWNASAGTIVLYTLVMTHITIVAVTVYLHRYSAHRALEMNGVLKHFFRFWLWMTTGMLTKEWTAVHRKHHADCETEEDPHSPQIFGLNKVLFEGAELYGVTAAKPEVLDRFGKGTPDDWVEHRVYSKYKILGIALMMIIDLLLFGVIGLTVWAVQMLWIPFFAAGVINGIGHYWGYRNFECPDAARNLVPWGILIGGEELHNNHHTYPNSAKLSAKPWEFDIGWMWITLFKMLGLAHPLSTGPVVQKVAGKESIDKDTVWAVLNDRFRVMANYADRVVSPIVELEVQRADAATRGLLKRAKLLLTREETLVDDAGRNDISRAVTVSPVLKTVYDLKLQLQHVWSKRGGDAEVLVREFKQWCVDAESTGIQTLHDFVTDLKSYTVPKASAA
ncbi:MAG: fatty acid desaturase [Proteobacteria bacterium]|nr:fatty acid desaturase [Pseudomonadota bacterium]